MRSTFYLPLLRVSRMAHPTVSVRRSGSAAPPLVKTSGPKTPTPKLTPAWSRMHNKTLPLARLNIKANTTPSADTSGT